MGFGKWAASPGRTRPQRDVKSTLRDASRGPVRAVGQDHVLGKCTSAFFRVMRSHILEGQLSNDESVGGIRVD